MHPLLALATTPATQPVSIPLWIDLASVVVGSLSGILYAHERGLDLVGHVGLAILCGLGGGLIRDMVMQVGDVYMLRSRYAIAFTVATAVGLFFFPHVLPRHPNVFEWVDIVAVALFAAAGTDKAIVYDLHGAAVLLMGTITAVGGGMLRDVFLGEVPRIFQPSNLYAICAFAGSLAYLLLVRVVAADKLWALLACVVVTVGLRRWSLRYGVTSITTTQMEARIGNIFKRRD